MNSYELCVCQAQLIFTQGAGQAPQQAEHNFNGLVNTKRGKISAQTKTVKNVTKPRKRTVTKIQMSYPSSEDLVDGRRLLQRALGLNDRSHLFHVEHERVQRLLDVRVLFRVFA